MSVDSIAFIGLFIFMFILLFAFAVFMDRFERRLILRYLARLRAEREARERDR